MIITALMIPAASAFSSLARSSARFTSFPIHKRTYGISYSYSTRILQTGIIRAPPQTTPTTTTTTTSACNPTKTTTRLYSVEGDFDPEILQRDVSEAQAGSLRAKLRALYKFTRPHTIRGTILASIAGTIRALLDTPGAIATANWGLLLPRAVLGMVALLLGNAFIVGINQIYDDDIDKLNKPFLPVASGEMSKLFAWVTVITAGVVGPVLV